jgi:tetratricopeptide (TPR) repeat protein
MSALELPTHFGDLLQYFAQREHRSAGQLAEITAVPLKTIQSWLEGRVERPRDWRGILFIAAALNLARAEVDLLLKVANHRGIEEISSLVRASQEKQLLELLVQWETTPASTPAPTPTMNTLIVANQAAVFQAVPAPVHIYGRTVEFARLKQVLRSSKQICILQGMPGVGKTALAAKAALELRDDFPDGVLWAQVDKSDTMSILYSFAYAFGREVNEFQDLETRSAAVRDVLARKKCLIVLDSTYQTDEIHLLRPPDTSPSVVLITTTNRRVLDAEAEVIELQPFGGQQRTAGLEFFANLPASQDVEETEALTKIIDLVGGLPLALRIIASDLAQSSYLSAVEYYDYLYDERTRLENLSDWQEASKDVRASFEMSYNRLPTMLKTLFCSLAVFKKAEFSVEAAAAVVPMPIPKMKKALAQLEALSLIEPYTIRDRAWLAVDDAATSPYLERYRLHTLLFIFVTEKLAALQADYHERALGYYSHYVQRHHNHYATVALEWENIAHLVNWGANAPIVDKFLPLLEALTLPHIGVVGFLDARGYWRQAHQWLVRALSMVQADYFLHARLHFRRGLFALRLALVEEAETHLQQAEELLADLAEGEEQALYRAYVCETFAQLWMTRNRQTAVVWSERGVALLRHFQSTTAQHQRGYLLIRHGTILAQRGDLAAAHQLLEEAFILLPATPTAARISGLLTLGNIYDLKGQANQARDCWLHGVTLAEALGDNRRLAGLWLNLAIQAEELGNFAACAEYNQKALDLYQRIGDIDGEGRVLSNLAFTYLRQEQPDAALPYLQAAEQLVKIHPLADLAIHVYINYARWHLLHANLAQAHQLLEQAHDLSDQLGESEALAEIFRISAQVALQQQEYQQALRLIEKALTAGDEQSSEAGLSWGLKGEILRKLGETEQAQSAFQHSIELLTRYPFDQAKVQEAWDARRL